MKLFHLNPKTGKTSICQQNGKCSMEPIFGEKVHFKTKEESQLWLNKKKHDNYCLGSASITDEELSEKLREIRFMIQKAINVEYRFELTEMISLLEEQELTFLSQTQTRIQTQIQISQNQNIDALYLLFGYYDTVIEIRVSVRDDATALTVIHLISIDAVELTFFEQEWLEQSDEFFERRLKAPLFAKLLKDLYRFSRMGNSPGIFSLTPTAFVIPEHYQQNTGWHLLTYHNGETSSQPYWTQANKYNLSFKPDKKTKDVFYLEGKDYGFIIQRTESRLGNGKLSVNDTVISFNKSFSYAPVKTTGIRNIAVNVKHKETF